MNSKQRNKGIPIPQPALKLLILTAIFLFLLLIGGTVFGASPFTDDFEGYSIGDLSGQGGWATSSPYSSWEVSTTTVEVGNQSIDCYNGYCGNTRTGTQVASGKWVFWTYAGDDYSFGFWIKEGSSDICRVDVGHDTIWYYNGGFVDTGWELVYNDYQSLQIEWNATTDQCRIQYTVGWSDWFDAYDTFDYIDRLDIFATEFPNGDRFIDYISDAVELPCEVEHCGYCLTSTSCISADCSWYYSIYLQEYSCVPFFEPSAEECGSFFKCNYCGDQTTCEAELNCEWTDRGVGTQCYMQEPTVPPAQIDWEVPDIDDCSSLPALDTIVCEIKNLISGAIMPSQEKLETMYQTLGAFKEKFPFNYIGILNDFFTDITTDLEATTTIPIKILGATSTVSFTFWDATTTIGGQEESFKNILFDFTTFLVLMGWFVWFISLIKRFF